MVQKKNYDNDFGLIQGTKSSTVPSVKEIKDGIIYQLGDGSWHNSYCIISNDEIIITQHIYDKYLGYKKIKEFKMVFITNMGGKLDSDQKEKYNQYTHTINNKTFIFHNINYGNMGRFILINTNSNNYIGLYDMIFSFETPDNDKIIYASQGDSTKSDSNNPFAIGEKYTYFFSDWMGCWYFDNSVMNKYKFIDPWDLYGKDTRKLTIFNKYKKQLKIQELLNKD